MSVNFFAHRQSLIDAYKDVLNDKTDTDWALFTYEGNQNDLKVQATGDEGLDELESEFNSGKIMYAFVRVDDPNTNLKKFILIVWQGDGVPATRKGACANHVKDINRFFKGSHVTIYARNEDDVAPDEIMHQLMKSTTSFTFVAPKEDHSSQPAPVSSVYKRVNPEQEIKALKDDAFWLKAQQEEDERKKQEKKREIERRRLAAMELREQEARSEENRNKLVKAREKDITEKTKAQKLADDQAEVRAQEKKRWEQMEAEQEASFRESRRTRGSQSGSVYQRVNPEQEIKALKDDAFWLKAQQEEDERKKQEKKREIERRRLAAMELREQEARSEESRNKLVKAREKDITEKTKAQKLADDQAEIRAQEKKRWEAEQLVSQRSNNPRALWAQREKQSNQGPPPVRKYSSSGSRTSSISEYPAEPVKPMQQSPPPPVPEPTREPEPTYQQEQNYQAEPTYQQEQNYQAEPTYQQEQNYQAEPTYQQEQNYQAEPTYQQEQNYQAVPNYQQEQNYQAEPNCQQEPSTQQESNYQQEQNYQAESRNQQEPSQLNGGYGDQNQYATEDAYAETPDESYQPTYGNPTDISARALYDYQAADDSEITFDPGDIITNIEQIDEGWWRGQAPDGNYGLFPANYVELV